MGYNFGLWVTLWINNDASDFAFAAQHGYLLKSKTDPSQPCMVTWWNGTAGIVDLGNPDARAWYVAQLHNLQQNLWRRRLQVRHPVLRRVLRALPRTTPRWTT